MPTGANTEPLGPRRRPELPAENVNSKFKKNLKLRGFFIFELIYHIQTLRAHYDQFLTFLFKEK